MKAKVGTSLPDVDWDEIIGSALTHVNEFAESNVADVEKATRLAIERGTSALPLLLLLTSRLRSSARAGDVAARDQHGALVLHARL